MSELRVKEERRILSLFVVWKQIVEGTVPPHRKGIEKCNYGNYGGRDDLRLLHYEIEFMLRFFLLTSAAIISV